MNDLNTDMILQYLEDTYLEYREFAETYKDDKDKFLLYAGVAVFSKTLFQKIMGGEFDL